MLREKLDDIILDLDGIIEEDIEKAIEEAIEEAESVALTGD